MNFASNFALWAILIGRADGDQSAERRELVTLLQVETGKLIEIDDENIFVSRELNQPQTRHIRIEIRRFGIETNHLSTCELIDGASELFWGGYEFVLRVHCNKIRRQLATKGRKMHKVLIHNCGRASCFFERGAAIFYCGKQL